MDNYKVYKDLRKKILYVVLTNQCPLNCPFCFNKFVDNFKKCNTKPLSTKVIKNYINSLNPDVINFIGGEPLLFPEKILEVLDIYKEEDLEYKKRMWCISTNLYYKNMNDKQLEVLSRIQQQSAEYVSIGTSYSADRFKSSPGYINIFRDNMLKLHLLDIRIGITVTLTKDQIELLHPRELKTILDSVKAKAVNLERCIYPVPKTTKEMDELKQFYEEADKYMMECFKIFPREMNYQFNRFYESVKFRVPIFDNHCSETVWSLYDHGLYNGCPLNSTDNGRSMYVEKLKNNDCYNCQYYPYCKGDCECTRGMCAFPKQTLQYIKDLVKNDIKRK